MQAKYVIFPTYGIQTLKLETLISKREIVAERKKNDSSKIEF